MKNAKNFKFIQSNLYKYIYKLMNIHSIYVSLMSKFSAYIDV